jgi:hypothetical protein
MPLLNLVPHIFSIHLVRLAPFLQQLRAMPAPSQVPLEILPPAVRLERAIEMGAAVRA